MNTKLNKFYKIYNSYKSYFYKSYKSYKGYLLFLASWAKNSSLGPVLRRPGATVAHLPPPTAAVLHLGDANVNGSSAGFCRW